MAKKKDLLEGFELYIRNSRESSPDYAVLGEKSKRMTFSAVLTKRLGIQKWENVVIHFNPNTKTIALKKADTEEYGSRCFQRAADEMKGLVCRSVSLDGLIKFYKVDTVRLYEPDKQGNIILLIPIEE